MNITIDRAVLWRALEALRPQTAPSGAKRDAAFEELRAALAAQPSHTEAQRGEPALWRYRDSEQCIKPMDGYTPGEGWTPLYDNPQPERKHTDADLAAEYERGRKAGLTQAYDAALAQPERQPDADIDACIYAQCPDFDDAHEGPSLDDIRAIVRAAQPKPLFADKIRSGE